MANRIEIIQWRELGDDEDALRVEVFADSDDTSPLALISLEEYEGEEDELVWEYDDPDSVEHPGLVINELGFTDGDVIESHNGRKFRIDITEVN